MATVDLGSQPLKIRQFAGISDMCPGCGHKVIVEKQSDNLCGSDVEFGMLRSRHGDQVFWPVIALDAVDVMNHDVLWQHNTTRDLIDVSMLQDIAIAVSIRMLRSVQQDIATSHGSSATLPRCALWSKFSAQHCRVMSNQPSFVKPDVFAAFRTGELRDLGRLTTATFAQTGRCLPVGWWCHAFTEFYKSKIAYAKTGVIAQVMSLDKSWWTSLVGGSPRNLLVAATLAAIDRRIERTLSGVLKCSRELGFYKWVARAMARQITRWLIAMVQPTRNWLFAAALAVKGYGAHLPIIHLNDAIGG